MAQPQPQMPQAAFSPPQATPSPVPAQPGFSLPPNKRPRLSPGPPSQPQSPYSQQQFVSSPGATMVPSPVTTPAGSPPVLGMPQPPQLSQQQTSYHAPYTNGAGNGNVTPSIALPENRPTPPPLPPTSMAQTTSAILQPVAPSLPYTNATFGPAMPIAPQHPQVPQGAMGPPSRPADKPQKEYEYDVTDSLAGTGIDLRAEEQYLSELYAVDSSVPESRTGFSIHQAGNRSSLYGAGSANQPAQSTGGKPQNLVIAEAAEKAWQESAKRLASTRAVELKSPFLHVPLVQKRAEAIAQEYGLHLNFEMKTQQSMGRFRAMEESPRPVSVSTKVGPDGALVRTSGCWIPHDAYLADQIALLSISTKQRLRSLLQDADRTAVTRQTTSHGEIPQEWKEAAGPLPVATAELIEDGDKERQETVVTGDSATAQSNPLKRPIDASNSDEPARPNKVQRIPATTASTTSAMMRELGKAEREWEEARLRRRNARKGGTLDGGTTTSRAGSVAPSTPGSSAPDGEKAMTKKEQKRIEAAKKAEASSHANQNLTSREFLGMTRPGGLFGKKGGKSYSWMTGGGSGASTPKLGGSGKAGGTPSAGTPAPGPSALTVEGSSHRRPGAWREDKEKGKNIQLRDWVGSLEEDGVELKALQQAYLQLDASWPRY